MGFAIEQECLQCGAPLTVSETDRILICPFCDVQSFLFTPSYFRYILPDKAQGEDIIYVPYLRFRGSVFFCSESDTGHKIIDITQLGTGLKGLPISLGLRPQAMKARFASGDIPGKYLKFTLKASEILLKASRLSSGSKNILHRAFIGETMSIMYLPVYLKEGRLYDAVLNRPITEYREGEEVLEKLLLENIPETISFLPTVCPQCGWSLKGERDSVVLTCDNCDTAWEAKNGKFMKVETITAQAEVPDGIVYIPFWKITAKTDGINIESFADFLRLTNQPVAVNKRHESMEMSYWSPAFKIRPKMFLNTSKQFTLAQIEFDDCGSIPERGLFPVTLPLSEAVQSLKMILVSSAVMKRGIFPNIPRITFNISNKILVYIPFRETRYDMIHDESGISINRQSLEFGRKL